MISLKYGLWVILVIVAVVALLIYTSLCEEKYSDPSSQDTELLLQKFCQRIFSEWELVSRSPYNEDVVFVQVKVRNQEYKGNAHLCLYPSLRRIFIHHYDPPHPKAFMAHF